MMTLIRQLMDRTSPYRSSACVVLATCGTLCLCAIMLTIAALSKRQVIAELGIVVTGLTTLVTTVYVKGKKFGSTTSGSPDA